MNRTQLQALSLHLTAVQKFLHDNGKDNYPRIDVTGRRLYEQNAAMLKKVNEELLPTGYVLR